VQRALDPGLQAPSSKHQASSAKLVKHQATSFKPFAASIKLQATSIKLQDPGPFVKFHDTRTEGLYHDKCIVGCFTWNAIWCGENRILFPLQTFNSTVKKWPEALQTNRSGVPDKLRFSSLIHEISGINFLIFAYNFCSGFKGSLSNPFEVFLAR
jgi:hypothetical protein